MLQLLLTYHPAPMATQQTNGLTTTPHRTTPHHTTPQKQNTPYQGAFNAIMSLWVLCGLLVFLLAFTLLEDEARVQVGRYVRYVCVCIYIL